MYYKFSQITSRIGLADQSSVYNPQGLHPIPRHPSVIYESPRVTFSKTPVPEIHVGQPKASAEVKSVSETKPMTKVDYSSKSLVQGKFGPYSPRIRELQELFGKNDGVPVHLKRGAIDRSLYVVTMGVTVLTAIAGGYVLFSMAFPKKSQE